MISKIIFKEDLSKLINALINDFVVIAPTAGKDVPTLAEISNSREVIFEKELPMIPPKKVFLPANQTMYRYSLQEGVIESGEDIVEKKAKETILFGVNPCDITGVNVLERVFSENYSDDLFLNWREKTRIIGINCLEPCYENCFCGSMGSNDPKTGFDIMLTEIATDKFLAQPNSDEGKILLRDYSEFFQEPESSDLKAFTKALQKKRKNFSDQKILAEGLPSMIEDSFKAPVWKEFTEKCLFCGSCTFVCPTCYCYDVKDELDVRLEEGKRERSWDSCYYPEFALVAGGHNFRAKKDQRFRYRYLHKFVDLPRRYNFEGCVGCGRCITYCPADIDVRDVLQQVRGEA
ncbi:MAG: hypothetical protein GF308_17060 [Candidatus Heimdallarchaeota archaeon]|nr:hypothetical protein [Candidatus Heimdallarchaeota archaeon]